MKTKRRKLWWKVLLAIVVALLIVLIGIGNFLVNYAIGRAGDGGNRQVALEVEEATTGVEKIKADNIAYQNDLTEVFLEEVPEEVVSVISNDGLKLNGGYYANEGHDWVVLCHGYRSNHWGMIGFGQRYHDAGFQVVIPDLRACGESEGDFVGMGWLDRKDILVWVNWILEQDPEAQIVVHGVSMGAATTMMTSGEDTPDAVKLFIEDCGYTSVYDIFASELKLRFHLPEVPIMQSASAMAKLRAKYTFKEASALKAVKKCEKPMMFIHGTLDDFIPFEMEQILYDAKPGDNKALVVAPEAGHGEACWVMGENYWDSVFDFIDTYTN